MHVGLHHYLFVSFMLFSLGLLGVIMRRNLFVIYMSLELMLNTANLALVAFSRVQQQARRSGAGVFHHHRGGGGSGGSAWRSSWRSTVNASPRTSKI